MSKEVKPKKPRSTKKGSEDTAQLEAKIAELEAKLANLSSQVTETKPAPRPAASGPTHGTLPAGMKPAPKPQPQPEPQAYQSESEFAEVAPAYSKISSSGYSGNRYFATRARLAYHPPNKQYTGHAETSTADAPPAPEPPKLNIRKGTLPAGFKSTAPPPAPERAKETLPAETKQAEKKSMWKAKGSEVAETYTPKEEHRAPPPPPEPQKASRGTLPAGFKPTTPPPAPKAESKPAPPPAPKPRPAASGPTHGTLPAGMKPAPKPEAKAESQEYKSESEFAEVAPAYSKISSSGYSGNRYFATRARLAYHPPNKQYTGHAETSTAAAPPAPEPPKLHIRKGTLPAGFKPSS